MKNTTANFITPKKLELHKISFFKKTKFFSDAETLKGGGSKTVACYIHNSYPLDMHEHDFFEINIVTNGFGVHYVNNKRIDVRPGSVFFIPQKVFHGYVNLGELEIFHIILPDSFFEAYGEILINATSFAKLFGKNSTEHPYAKELVLDRTRYTSIFSDIKEILNFSKNDVTCNLIQSTAVCQLILKLCLYRKEKRVKEKNNLYVSLIIDSIHYMENNLSHKITIDDICKKFYISKSTFIRVFTKYTCFSPIAYLTKLRIEKAKQLLLETENSVTDIALDCGFFDSSHLERYFKKYENTTPNYYRKTFSKK